MHGVKQVGLSRRMRGNMVATLSKQLGSNETVSFEKWFSDIKSITSSIRAVSYTHLTLPTNREV